MLSVCNGRTGAGRLIALCSLVYTDIVKSVLSLCNVCTGAGEDVEAVMERLRGQGSDNIALRERQAKLEKDQQVTTQLAKKKRTVQQS